MAFLIMNRVPLFVLTVTILTIICTIIYVITMCRGLDIVGQTIEAFKPEAADSFQEAPNFKQAMVFMCVLALVLALTHLVLSILSVSGIHCFIIRTPCMLALMLLTLLLQLAFIISVGILAMTTALVDAVYNDDPNLQGFVGEAMGIRYNRCESTIGECYRNFENSKKQGASYNPEVKVLQLTDDQFGENWLDEDQNDEIEREQERIKQQDKRVNDFSYLPPYRAAMYRNAMGSNESILREIRSSWLRAAAEESENDSNSTLAEAAKAYPLLITALAMNILLVMFMTFYTIIRATNLATAVCNECCVPMEC